MLPIDLQPRVLDVVDGERAALDLDDLRIAHVVLGDLGLVQRLAARRIPEDFDFARLGHLRAEAREKLARVRPRDLAQASRTSGITPADVATLMIHLEGSRQCS